METYIPIVVMILNAALLAGIIYFFAKMNEAKGQLAKEKAATALAEVTKAAAFKEKQAKAKELLNALLGKRQPSIAKFDDVKYTQFFISNYRN